MSCLPSRTSTSSACWATSRSSSSRSEANSGTDFRSFGSTWTPSPRPGRWYPRGSGPRNSAGWAGPIYDSVQTLDQHRLTHAACHAHRLDAVAAAGGLQAVDERRHDARPGHPEGVAQGDRAAERVQLLVRDPELLLARDDLCGERLVDLD